jgi:ribose/xylose/arabinose/galactoside ABC-type transport system permease subunit
MSSSFGRGWRRAAAAYAFLLLALAAECVIFELLARHRGAPSFLTVPALIGVLQRAAEFGVIAVGMTFIIITGGIDLSVGSFMALGGVLCALVVQEVGPDAAGVGMALGALAAFSAGALGGSVTGAAVTLFRVPSFIATLALMSSVRGVAFLIVGGTPVGNLPPAYTTLGLERILGLPISVGVMLATMLAGGVLLTHTPFGRHVRAIGGNEEAARLSGLPVRRVKALVYIMGAMLAVLGGLIMSSKLGSGDPKIGLGAELEVIAAVVVGGTSLSGGRGTILGTFLGLIVIAALRSGLNWVGVESFVQQVILGAVIFAAVLLDKLKGKGAA